MALVAYGDSDISDSEGEQEEQLKEDMISDDEDFKPQTIISESKSTEDNFFVKLPQPLHRTIIEEDDEFLLKKPIKIDEKPALIKPRARITIPSLADFKDVENVTSQPKQPSKKGSGLLSLLPKPKNEIAVKIINNEPLEKLLITSSTSSVLTPTILKKQSLERAKQASEKLSKKTLISTEYDDSDQEDDKDLKNDFFSFNLPSTPQDDILPVDIEDFEPQKKVRKLEIEPFVNTEEQDEYNQNCPADSELIASSTSDDVILDDEAIRILGGHRGRNRMEKIEIIDVNQQHVLDEARENLLKGLTEETSNRPSASKKKGNEPSTQQRKKHQITYLAHQAKANELDLQNQWANNRLTRKQTQSKYGF